MRNQPEHRRVDDIVALPQSLGGQDYFFVDESMYSISRDRAAGWSVLNHTVGGRTQELGRIVEEGSGFVVELDGERLPESDLRAALSHFTN